MLINLFTKFIQNIFIYTFYRLIGLFIYSFEYKFGSTFCQIVYFRTSVHYQIVVFIQSFCFYTVRSYFNVLCVLEYFGCHVCYYYCIGVVILDVFDNGNSQYINSNATTSITVKKINTKLLVKVSNSTPVNSTSITITATLTDANNKAVVNQNITLNVASKTFNVKTNSNGVATQNYTQSNQPFGNIIA